MNSSRKNTHCENYEKVDKTIENWPINQRRQEIPINGVIIKEKVLEFAKALGVTEFKASDCWLINAKSFNCFIHCACIYCYENCQIKVFKCILTIL